MHRHLLFVVILIEVTVLSIAGVARADWTRFRGPNGSGIASSDQPMPVRWSASANLEWKAELPGAGASCPIVVGDRVFVTCYSGYGTSREEPGEQKDLKRHIVCLDSKDGKVLWSKTIDAVLPEDPYDGIGVPAHGYASSTPISDGKNVFVFFGKTGALAFDENGEQLWQTSVGIESDPRRWGSASSPILYKNLLIVPAAAESEALIALDKKTGKEVWRQEASGLANSWSTPILVEVNNGRTDLVIGVTQEIWGLNPKTGKLRWYCEGAKSNSFCSSLVADGGIVYAVEGRSGVSIAVRAGGQGDVTKSHVVWTGRDSSRFGSPIVRNGRIFTVANGVASVTDAKTGERISRTRLEGSGAGSGQDYGSPILADGKLYYVRQSGEMFVLQADDKLEQLAHNRVINGGSELFNATPAATDGRLFVRSDEHLYCIAAMGQPVPENALANRTDGDKDDTPSAEGSGQNRAGRGDRQDRRAEGRNFDPSAMFKSRDTDGDGKLTADELPERLKGRMEQLDSNKDGAVTLEELKKGMSRRGSGGRNRGGPRGNPREGIPDRPQRPEMEE